MYNILQGLMFIGLLASTAQAQDVRIREFGAAATLNFELFELDDTDLATSATFAAGDCILMENNDAQKVCTNLPVDEGTGYSLNLTAAEMDADRVTIYLVDQTAPKVWRDRVILIETYGNQVYASDGTHECTQISLGEVRY